MSRADWIEASAFLCIVALLLGIGVGFFIDGMKPAALIGTIPSWAFLLAVRLTDRRKTQRIEDKSREWFV